VDLGTGPSIEPEIKISPKIYFYDKDNFNCLCISEEHVTKIKKIINGHSKGSRPFNNYFTNVEEKKIKKIFEELIKDFNLYTKRCEAFNCKHNNEYSLKQKKYFKELKIKKHEIKFKPQKYTERGFEPKIKIAPIIYFYDKNKFNCFMYIRNACNRNKTAFCRWCL
jgi:hypothetical protein